MHSGEQKVAKPELRFKARCAGIHVPQLSHRTSLLFEGVLSREAVVALTFVATLSDCTIFGRVQVRTHARIDQNEDDANQRGDYQVLHNWAIRLAGSMV